MTTFGTNYGNLELQYALAVQDAISYYLVDGTMPNYGTLYGNSEKRLAIAIVENTTIGGGGGGGNAIWGGITGTLSDQTDLSSALSGKQSTLVSGTNIKTINGESLLGNGNLAISGGGLPLTGNNPPINIIPTYDGELYVDTALKQFYLGSLTDNSWYRLTTTKLIQSVLLIHFDGANNSTNFIDEKGKSITKTGTPVISTTQSKFGGSSGYFNGSSYLSIGSNPDFSFDGDFTIEFWCYFDNNTNYMTLLDTGWQSGGLLIQTLTGTSNIGVWINGSQQGGGYVSLEALNQWAHVAIVRSQNIVFLFANGVKHTLNYHLAGVLGQVGLNIGKDIGANYFLNGYIDELRVTKGIARYTTDFTPPTAPFVD